jgi:hypothetical protein
VFVKNCNISVRSSHFCRVRTIRTSAGCEWVRIGRVYLWGPSHFSRVRSRCGHSHFSGGFYRTPGCDGECKNSPRFEGVCALARACRSAAAASRSPTTPAATPTP